MKRESKHQPYEKLKKALMLMGVTYKQVSQVIGTSESTVMLKINGGSDFFITEMMTISDEFGIPMATFFNDDVA